MAIEIIVLLVIVTQGKAKTFTILNYRDHLNKGGDRSELSNVGKFFE